MRDIVCVRVRVCGGGGGVLRVGRGFSSCATPISPSEDPQEAAQHPLDGFSRVSIRAPLRPSHKTPCLGPAKGGRTEETG